MKIAHHWKSLKNKKISLSQNSGPREEWKIKDINIYHSQKENLQEMMSEAAAAIITQDRKLKQEAYLIS